MVVSHALRGKFKSFAQSERPYLFAGGGAYLSPALSPAPALRRGRSEAVYCYLYDIVPDQVRVIRQPVILIVEGLNILQTGDGHLRKQHRFFVSDFFDYTIYLDAEEADIE